jgi:nucleoside-diphosphate-sugar epimerase
VRSPPALVTGAAGFFGSAIVRSLARAGVQVIATDRVGVNEFRPRSGTPGGLVEYIERDLAEGIDDLVADGGGVIHAAALTAYDDTEPSVLDDLLRVNVEAFCSVLRAVRASPAPRLFFVSSTSVYDQSPEKHLAEEDATGQASVYGAAKLAAEILGRRYAAVTGIELCVVRPSALFGAGEAERPSRPRVSEFAQLVRAAAEGARVRVENATSRADWLSVDDAADAVALLWDAGDLGGRTFNLTSASPRPFTNVVEAVASVVSLELVEDDADVVVDGGPDRPAVISNARLRDAIDWEPSRTHADAARELLGARQRPSEG